MQIDAVIIPQLIQGLPIKEEDRYVRPAMVKAIKPSRLAMEAEISLPSFIRR